jgi:hypothetical protein
MPLEGSASVLQVGRLLPGALEAPASSEFLLDSRASQAFSVYAVTVRDEPVVYTEDEPRWVVAPPRYAPTTIYSDGA